MTSSQFSSGEVAYRMNGSADAGTWKQTLGTDTYPFVNGGHENVYYGKKDCKATEKTYSNTVPHPDHQYVDGVCSVCSKALNYSVQYDANGGSGTMSNQTFTCGTAQKLSGNAFTRTGYIFAGWNTKADGTGTSYTNQQQVINLAITPDAVVTLYAQWTACIYKVVFDANGGEGTMADQTFTYGTAQALTANAFTHGYTFAGWNTKADGTGTTYTNQQQVTNLATTQDAVVTLYAQWTDCIYKVVFDANGGEGTMADQTFTYGTAQALTANTFTRTGYTFAGWNTVEKPDEENPGTAYTNEAEVSNLSATNGATVNLYAQWTNITYTVKFHANGGEGTMEAQTYTCDKEQALTANAFNRTGYYLTGWNTVAAPTAENPGTAYADKADGSRIATTSGATVTLYAQWALATYTVAFNANGNNTSGEMADQTFTYNEKKALTANNFTRTGYTFAGWNTVEKPDEENPGTAYSNEAEVSNLSATNGATVNLYAQWINITYTVKFHANGGEGTMNDQTLTYDRARNLAKNTYTRESYAFTGWSKSADGDVYYRDEAGVKNMSSTQGDVINLYAQWEKIWRVQYEFKGEIQDTLTTYSPESGVGTLPTADILKLAKLDSEDFSAIYTIKGTKKTFTADTKISGDIVVVATPAAHVTIPSWRKCVSFNCPKANLDFTKAKEVEAFAVDGNIIAHKLDSVPSNTGVILQKTGYIDSEPTEVLIPVIYDNLKEVSRNVNILVPGTLITIYQGYVWGSLWGEEAFWRINEEDGIAVPDNRCYLDYNRSYAKINVSFNGGEPTFVKTIEDNKPAYDSDATYNLAGMKVGKNYKGIVIKNGKKIIK